MKDQIHVIITLLSCITHVISEFQCQGTCYSGSFPKNNQVIRGKYLRGYSYKNITTDVPRTCFSSCINDCRCKAFQMKDVRCELLDEDKASKAEGFVDETGYVYYDLQQTSYKEKSLAGVCYNGCCRSQPCMNGGTCVEHCEKPKIKFSCKCPNTHSGKVCEKKIESCIDVLKVTAPGFMPANGTYIITRNDTKTTVPIYCAFESPNQPWTLIESFALANNEHYQKKAFFQDVPRNHLKPSWDDYRLSLSDMQYLQNKASQFRATCDYEKSRSSLIPDLLIGYKRDLDIIFYEGSGSCFNFSYINLRGNEFSSTKAPVYQKRDKLHLHLDVSRGLCGFTVPGTISSEDLFGVYSKINPISKCTATPQSTTQWWLGQQQ